MTVYVSSQQLPAVLVYQDDPVQKVEDWLTAWMQGLDDPEDQKENPWETISGVLHCFDDEIVGRVVIDWQRVTSLLITEEAPDRHLSPEARLPRLLQAPLGHDSLRDGLVFVEFPPE
ncbi:hypothetical protein ACLTEW_07405 [Gordonia lacunae]|uniref:hypothetical protein n=1 Tax=Gordonia lacunae TaxID=417102 RepID=UPI0039E27ABC